MDPTNPYEAPRSELGGVGANAGDSELAAAVADLIASRGLMIGVAVFLVLAAVVSCASTMSFIAFSEQSGARMVIATTAAAALGYVAVAAALGRAVMALRPLARAPTYAHVAAVFRTMTLPWWIGSATQVIPSLLYLAFQVTTLLVPAVPAIQGVVAGADNEQDVVVAARRLRMSLLVFLVATGAVLLLRFGTLFAIPGEVSFDMLPLQTRFWWLGGALVQLLFGWLVWRQVTALEAFIAQPNVATLRIVTTSHRLLWRTTAWGGLAFVTLGFVVSVGTVFFLGR